MIVQGHTTAMKLPGLSSQHLVLPRKCTRPVCMHRSRTGYLEVPASYYETSLA